MSFGTFMHRPVDSYNTTFCGLRWDEETWEGNEMCPTCNRMLHVQLEKERKDATSE